MIYICNCGRQKTVQPYSDSRIVRGKWVCSACIDGSASIRLRLLLEGKLRPHDGIGRRRGLKIPGQ